MNLGKVWRPLTSPQESLPWSKAEQHATSKGGRLLSPLDSWEIIDHCLVGGLVAIFYFPIYWVANHPNWLSYFSEGWPNQQPVVVFIKGGLWNTWGFEWPKIEIRYMQSHSNDMVNMRRKMPWLDIYLGEVHFTKMVRISCGCNRYW